MFRFFQAAGFGSYYLNEFNKRYSDIGSSFKDRQQALLYDRYGATHILKPIYDQNPDAFFTVCDDHVLQARWADENGLKTNNLSDILLAQIEEHRTEIFYNLDPIGFSSEFVRQLPANVKKKLLGELHRLEKWIFPHITQLFLILMFLIKTGNPGVGKH